jgi:hypothetical protein
MSSKRYSDDKFIIIYVSYFASQFYNWHKIIWVTAKLLDGEVASRTTNIKVIYTLEVRAKDSETINFTNKLETFLIKDNQIRNRSKVESMKRMSNTCPKIAKDKGKWEKKRSILRLYKQDMSKMYIKLAILQTKSVQI